MAAPEPFRIHVSDDDLTDLRQRLQRARVPDQVGAGQSDPNGAWAYGTDKAALQDYVSHWLTKFDWRQQEAKLNAVPQFTLQVNGLKTHFIHQRSKDTAAIPLLLVHGWPGSFVEFMKLLPLLKKFHVVAPSIPGYGFSEAPKEPGASVVFMAEQLAELMRLLGYTHYVAQGGDWGSIITTQVAGRYPERCVALHLNMCAAIPSTISDFVQVALTMPSWSKEEWDAVRRTQYFMKYETGYQKIQGTKPQTLGYGLNDSPVGLLAWILEKFQSWSDSHGQRPDAPGGSGLTMDEILTNVMIYWSSQSITSSCRLYYETLGLHPSHKEPLQLQPGEVFPRDFQPPRRRDGSRSRLLDCFGRSFRSYVAVPTGVIWSKAEIIKVPRKVAELRYNIKHWYAPPKGGHFFAFEQPELMAKDLNHFFFEVIDFPTCVQTAPARSSTSQMPLLGATAMVALLVAAVALRLRRSRL
ncbi:Putative epoxide hydrolase (Epoxide hydratase) [Durusdinium trenchii]|uniref:Epoxide hydrolase (Epoxide hydratase) n=1 Tax=Durusdinium trenchii TaxID=1381693 RepID=A0ABP0SA42_9DINO